MWIFDSPIVASCALGTKNCFDTAIRYSGPLFVLVASVLITLIAWVHFSALIPYHGGYFSLLGMIHLIASGYVAFCIGFNYFMVITTPPGSLSKEVLSENELRELMEEAAPKKGEGFSRYCKTCKRSKPPRSHHCHVCKTCVFRMDHHCPWIGNCVGYYNHKFFVLFMFYLCMGCLYVACMAFKPFLDVPNFEQPWELPVSRNAITFCFIITVAVFFAVGGLCCWHFFLLLTNQTTIEFYVNQFAKSAAKRRGEKWQNEFDLGVKKNFQIFFGSGKYWISWLLPSISPNPGDGMSYLTRSQYHRQIHSSGIGEHFV